MRFTAETRGYLKRWTYERTYSVRTIFSEPKFLGCIVYQISLRMVLRCARYARESSAIKHDESNCQGLLFDVFR